MNEKSQCFISYCRHDVSSEEIEYLISAINRYTNKDIEFIFDLNLRIGKNLIEHMDLLNRVDLVLMICSPKYKEKAEIGEKLSFEGDTFLNTEKGGGVGYEYRIIKERYIQIQAEKRESLNQFLSKRRFNPFEVLPVILKGEFTSSVPEYFKGNKAIDLSYYKLLNKHEKSGGVKKTIPRNSRLQFELDLNKIIGDIKGNHIQKQPSYEDSLKTNHDLLKIEMLFYDTKADFDNPEYSLNHYEDTLFVRTNVYKQIENQTAYLIIGRKGSGKSAITQVLPIRSKNFKTPYMGVIDVYANRDINFPLLYNFLNEEFLSDSKNVFKRIDCFKFGWILFFRICLINILINSYENRTQKSNGFQNLVNFIKRIKQTVGKEITDSKSMFFTYSFNSIQRFMKHCFDVSRPETEFFYSDIDANFNINSFLIFAMGEKTFNNLNEYMEYLPKKFLITFDGFDTEIEKFRENNKYYDKDDFRDKVKFEIDWLHSLLLLVNDIKQLKNLNDSVNSRLDFCITIPNHRYLEILSNDRDSYRFQHRRKNIIWSGLELVLFLRKRLEILSSYKVAKSDPIVTLNEILKNKFNYIPTDIEFEFNGNTISMPLFLYVLRHTFWRPRDILLYYAHIITLCTDCRERNYKVTTEAIRTNIANLTFEIIKDDFKNEFSGMLRNIEDIIESFHRSKQILSFREIENILYKIEFDFSSGNNEIESTNIIQKIKFLYQIGFLGVYGTKEIQENYNTISKHIFIFNEGCKVFRRITKEKIQEFQFIIHPIFCEYLELDTKDNEFIAYYNWEYINELEGFMKAFNEDYDCE